MGGGPAIYSRGRGRRNAPSEKAANPSAQLPIKATGLWVKLSCHLERSALPTRERPPLIAEVGRKLGARSRVELVRIARILGTLDRNGE